MNKYRYIAIVFFILAPFMMVFADVATSTADTLKAKIEERNQQIKQLEAQIQQYNTAVTQVGAEKKTLQSTLQTLTLTQKKLNTDLSLTNTKIDKTKLTITELEGQIQDTENHIDTNKQSISNLLQTIQQNDQKSLIEMILAGKDIRELWGDFDTIQRIQRGVKEKSDELRTLATELGTKEKQKVGEKNKLTNLKQDLSGQKQVVEQTAKEKATLLAQTKNKEQAFKDLITVTEAQKAKFEQEVFDFESQLNIAIDKGGYPSPKLGILSWPLDSIRITQRFGKTVGAEKLYTSGSHNGVDFAATIGTRVKSVLDGVVVGTGNTDAYPGCYSFGKWVMVKHGNGLSTIYGHLSAIAVTTGTQVSTGDLLGYSGNTGYSTGPHLHVSVYATQGVRIEQFVNSRGCKQAIIPLADVKAYLDPMAYFPGV